jgi:predicted short-subunit dehydrogenase-like oxidoreductase (DUF2520 family)
MKIVIIGSGNSAAVLGRKLKSAGHQIIQVISRNAHAASALAYEWDTVSSNYISAINLGADVYLIAVSDDAITEVVNDLKLPGKIIAHTAGSVSKDILKNVSTQYGVFYPLQSLRKDLSNPEQVPIFIDASDTETKLVLEKLAQSISPGHVAAADADERMKLHIAAIMVNNFTNYLFALAEDYCKKEGLDFKQLLPLIEETVARLKTVSPSKSMTGPAIRHDKETIQKHLKLLENHPEIKKVYELMSDSISDSGL